MDCVFCKIIKGDINAVKVWEDENFSAFLDARPINPGHTLLVPRKHDEYLFDLSDSDYSSLMLKAKELAIMLKEKLGPKKIGLAVEGFGVGHVHIHLLPINGPREMDPNKAKEVSTEELTKIAEKIKS